MSTERTRSWRRFNDRINKHRGMGSDFFPKPEKNWKLMYLRTEKLARAKQLGMDYPIRSFRQLLDRELPFDG